MLTPAFVPTNSLTDKFCEGIGENSLPCTAADAKDAIATTIDFASDPFGYVGEQLGAACTALVTEVIPSVINAAQPDLSSDFFVKAYTISWGLSFVMLVFVLFANFWSLGRGKTSTADVAETLTIFLPAWLVGVLVGPMIGQLLIGAVWDLVADLWKWPGFGAGTNLDGTGQKLANYVGAGPSNTIPGGDLVLIVVLGFMLIALLLVVVVLLVMTVTLYFAGALFPVLLVWIMKPGQRSKGLKVVYLWLGVLFAIPAMFFGLGLAFSMVNAGFQLTIPEGADPKDTAGAQNLVNLLLALVVIALVALAPFALPKMLGNAAPEDSGEADKSSDSGSSSGGGGGSSVAGLSQKQANAPMSAPPAAAAGGGPGSPGRPGGSGDSGGSSRAEPAGAGAGSAGGGGKGSPQLVRAGASSGGGSAGGGGAARSASSKGGAVPAGMPMAVAGATAKAGKKMSSTAQMSARSASESAASSGAQRREP